MNKFCPKCQADKPVEEFPVNRSRKDGRAGVCLLCQRDYCKAHYNKNKPYYFDRNSKRERVIKDYIKSLKIESKCSTCGYDKCLSALHFHHLDDTTKDVNLSVIFLKGWSLERVQKEVEKCIIVCANCHAEIHEKLRSNVVVA